MTAPTPTDVTAAAWQKAQARAQRAFDKYMRLIGTDNTDAYRKAHTAYIRAEAADEKIFEFHIQTVRAQ